MFLLEDYTADDQAELYEKAKASGIHLDDTISKGAIDLSGSWRTPVPIQVEHKEKVSVISRRVGDGRIIVTFNNFLPEYGANTWSAKPSEDRINLMTPAARKRIKQVQADSKARDIEENTIKSDVKEVYFQRFLECWKSDWTSDQATASFPYFVEKNVADLSLKVMNMANLSGEDGFKDDYRGDFLVIPMYKHGEIVAFQRIYVDHDPGKMLLVKRDGISSGAYGLVGASNVHELKKQPFYITEGIGQALTVHEAMERPVVIAMSAGNIIPAYYQLQYEGVTGKNATICVDYDTAKANEHGIMGANTGMLVGVEAAYTPKAKVKYPYYKGEKIDFNDLMNKFPTKEEGLAEVRRQLTGRTNVVPIAKNKREHELNKLKYAADKPNILFPYIKSCLSKHMSDLEIKNNILTARPKHDSITISRIDSDINVIRNMMQKETRKSHDIVKENYKDDKQVSFLEIPTVFNNNHHSMPVDIYEKIKHLEGIVVLKYPTGASKTQRIVGEVAKLVDRKGTAGAVISHRTSLAKHTSQELDIDNYQRHTLKEGSLMTIVLNSISHPRFKDGDMFENLEAVCIDEPTKVIHHLCGGTVANKQKTTSVFSNIVRTAKVTYLMDADANDNLIEQMKSIAPDAPITVVTDSNVRMDHIKVEKISAHAAIEKACDLVEKDQKVIIPTDSKSTVRNIEAIVKKRAPSKRVLAIHADNVSTPEVRDWLKSPAEESCKYDCVVYSPVVDSGVSLVTRHFDHTIGVFWGIVPPQGILQMMARNRTEKQWVIGCSALPEQYFQNRFEPNKKALESQLGDDDMLTTYDLIALQDRQNNAEARADYDLKLKYMLEQKGYRVSWLDNEDTKESKEEYQKISREMSEKIREKTLNSEIIDKEEYVKIKNRYTHTEEQAFQLMKYEFMSRLALAPEDINDGRLKFYFQGGAIKVDNFQSLVIERKIIDEFDAYQADTMDTISTRKNWGFRQDLYKKLFSCLRIDIKDGSGEFNYTHARSFVEWLQGDKDRLATYNLYKMGPFLSEFSKKDPIKLVEGILRNLGLKSTRVSKSNKNYSREIVGWGEMYGHHLRREEASKSIAKTPPVPTTLEIHEKDGDFEVKEVKDITPPIPDELLDYWASEEHERLLEKRSEEWEAEQRGDISHYIPDDFYDFEEFEEPEDFEFEDYIEDYAEPYGGIEEIKRKHDANEGLSKIELEILMAYYNAEDDGEA